MDEGDRPDEPSPSALTPGEPRTCYRCGKPEDTQRPLRLLPGSAHIVVCPVCYEVLWGWKEQPRTL